MKDLETLLCGQTYGSGCRGSGTNGMHVCGKSPGHGDDHGDCILNDG